ncbi:MAG: phage protease [Bacteroidota bacterium]|nr:phage protease [Bacteroidota bacterium]
MNKFYKIFKAGKYPQGEITQADVAEIATGYDRNFHEAPLTVNHESTSPAYAVVDQLQERGGVLYASFDEVLEEAYAMNKKFKKPSVEIATYDDKKYLRAVTLTNFPSVKGLDKIQFDDLSAAALAQEDNSAIFFSDFNLNLNKGETMISETIKKFAEKISLNISDYQSDGDVIDSALKIINNLKIQFADSSEKINSLSLSLSKFTEANISVEKFGELSEEVKAFKKQRVDDLLASAVTNKNILPANVENLRTFAEQNFDAAKKLIDALPAKSQPPVVAKFISEEKELTYKEVMADPKLAQQLSEEQINDLKAKSKIFN